MTTINRSSATILLAEDNPDDVLLTQRAFRKAGISAHLQVATDGEDVIHYFEGRGRHAERQLCPMPSLLLLDWKLPRRNGLDVLTWIRERPSLDTMPVVVLTSSDQERDIQQAYAAGANSYLKKPVQFQALIEMMQMLDAYWLRLNISLSG